MDCQLRSLWLPELTYEGAEQGRVQHGMRCPCCPTPAPTHCTALHCTKLCETALAWQRGAVASEHCQPSSRSLLMGDHGERVQDSVAVAPPELQHPDSDTLYLEAWRGLRPIGNSVNISVTSLLLVRSCLRYYLAAPVKPILCTAKHVCLLVWWC